MSPEHSQKPAVVVTVNHRNAAMILSTESEEHLMKGLVGVGYSPQSGTAPTRIARVMPITAEFFPHGELTLLAFNARQGSSGDPAKLTNLPLQFRGSRDQEGIKKLTLPSQGG